MLPSVLSLCSVIVTRDAEVLSCEGGHSELWNPRMLKVSKINEGMRNEDSRLFCAGFTLQIISVPDLVGIIDTEG